MSEMADRVLCEKFEANIFAKNRCQNCFRTVAAHQHGHQELEKHGAKTPDSVAGADEASTREPLDPLCILVPQCELYVCVGPEDRTESWKEGLEYTQLGCRAQEEPEEARICLDANITACIGTDANDPLSRDWEMTRILDSILGSNREDTMYYAGQKEEVQPESLPSDRLRWTEVVSSGRTEFWRCLKAGTRAVSQDQGEGKRKHQAESGYFSLERRKSEPGWASSPPRVSCGTVPRWSDGPGVGGWPTSPVTSADRDLGWRAGSSTSEGRHGLMRQEYTVLADLPKPKRLHHRQAFEKDGSSSRTRSPGRVEVERIFGPERRKSETLEAFQALEEGLLERLDSKSLKLAKEGQLVRRQSSPTLRRDVSKQLPRDSAQPSRSGGESLRSGRPDQRHERVRRSQGPSLHSGGAPQHLERESQSRGATLPLGAHFLSKQRGRGGDEMNSLTTRERVGTGHPFLLEVSGSIQQRVVDQASWRRPDILRSQGNVQRRSGKAA
ncbi:hypothetical protein JRQ81_016284 [Phrynocephalus forsythii]|uniref:Uncharacterized protein n=1 Tax=Phrynocephalus forsythii TaxID=171643 RepID=A0A9Q1B2J0_9SAUR|nr:hypothetical protein JRQ81_016284 [Phrynocephalus forsythii]